MNSIIWELNKRLPLLNVRLKIENFTVPPRAFIRRYYGIYLLLSIFFKRSTFYVYCSIHKMSIDVWSRKLYARWSMRRHTQFWFINPIQTGLFRAPQNWRGGGYFHPFIPPLSTLLVIKLLTLYGGYIWQNTDTCKNFEWWRHFDDDISILIIDLCHWFSQYIIKILIFFLHFFGHLRWPFYNNFGIMFLYKS